MACLAHKNNDENYRWAGMCNKKGSASYFYYIPNRETDGYGTGLSKQFNIIDNIAKSQARLYFYYHIWHLIFIQTFWDTIFYDILQTGTHLLSIILITYVLYLYTNNKHYLLYPLIYISTTPILWDHTLTTSVPLYHFTYLIKLCLIFILI